MDEGPVQPAKMTNKQLWKLVTPYICLGIASIVLIVLAFLYSNFLMVLICGSAIILLAIIVLAIIQRKSLKEIDKRITDKQRMMMQFVRGIVLIAVIIIPLISFNIPLCAPPTNLDKGIDAYDYGYYNDSITFLTLYIDTNPNSANAYFWRGASYWELGDLNKSLADFNQSINLNPSDAKCYQWRAAVYHALGDMESALSDLNQSIKLDPRNSVTYDLLGMAYYEIGNMDSAIANYNQSISLNPTYAFVYYNRGLVEQSLKHDSEAIADFQKCLTLNPSVDIRQKTVAALQQLGVTP